MHEGGMISPCIVQWPQKIQPAKGYVDGPAHVIDLLPTALELAGVKAKDLPGESLSWLWNGKNVESRTLYWEHEGNKAIRKGNLKLLRDLEDPAWELYDLSKDPAETNNLATAKPGLVGEMMTEYQAWADKVGVKNTK